MGSVLELALLLAVQAAPDPPAVEAGYDGGFFVRGRDARLSLEGLLQVNGSFFERGAPHESEFVLRRLRLEFSGEFFDRWLFHLEPKFTAEGSRWRRAGSGSRRGTPGSCSGE
jgi:hypothetical protein